LQHHERDLVLGYISLEREARVHRDQDIELPLSSNQLAVLESGPAQQRNGFHDLAWQFPTQPPVQVFVEEDLTSGRTQKLLERGFEQGNHLLSMNTRKSFEKVIDGFARFQMIEQTLRGHASAGKNRSAP